ncbi:MAG: cadmium-translocating P-type ATPase [Oscillospiraceae bacterium]|nr:cadmium-translocating P-type ATPase [Oscillospiraceae bacterium]
MSNCAEQKGTNYIFRLEALDCANCGAKIEKAVGSLDYVYDASLNFITQVLTVTADDSCDEDIFDRVTDIVHRYEEDVIVVDISSDDVLNTQKPISDQLLKQYIPVAIGLILYILNLIIGAIYHPTLLFTLTIYIIAYILAGYDVILAAAKSLLHAGLFDEHLLMSIASIGAFIIGEYPEAVAVMLIYKVGEFLQSGMTNRARISISDLMKLKPDYANVIRDGQPVRVTPELIAVGEIISIRPGEVIPLDGIVIEGMSTIDSSSLTGESLPTVTGPTDNVISGTLNISGLLKVEVTKTYRDSTVRKIMDLTENASNKKATIEQFITKFARYYTPAVVVLALLTAVVPPLFSVLPFSEWVRRSLSFLVVSCPCALVISVPLAFYCGVGVASKQGILVKGANYLYALTKLEGIIFDKTGTLTGGNFLIDEILPAEGVNMQQLIRYAVNSEVYSVHPIAASIRVDYFQYIDTDSVTDFLQLPGLGVSAMIDGRRIYAGNYMLMEQNCIHCSRLNEADTVVYLAADDKYLGAIILSDTIKRDARDTIIRLRRQGISDIYMMTGDSIAAAELVATLLGGNITVAAELLPDAKLERTERLLKAKQKDRYIAFVGDGVNDAPVISRVDIGIAMGALGSDAAIEAADIVLMTDQPSKLNTVIDIARFTKRIVWQNIILALFVKLLVLVMSVLGLAGMSYAVVADVGVAVVAIFNCMRIWSVTQKRNFKT